MDPRRVVPSAVSDPIVRQVGFFALMGRSDPIPSSSPASNFSPSGNSLSPVMIPPPRHLSIGQSRNLDMAPALQFLSAATIHLNSYPLPRPRMFPRILGIVHWRRCECCEIARQCTRWRRANDGKLLKEKTTKAEHRAIQEAQRAAKAASKGHIFLVKNYGNKVTYDLF
ncbi:Unknown protein [Striga hermonthica]|uniref:Uncharacterized protein n=1 Tax=Striga hermonthica TaxID=68872 RepID=A0A9N7NG71_STRHE|nr:Unknown protein [Striga hermonthica]